MPDRELGQKTWEWINHCDWMMKHHLEKMEKFLADSSTSSNSQNRAQIYALAAQAYAAALQAEWASHG